MPVRLTNAAPGEWPAHLAPIGKGDTKRPLGEAIREFHRARERAMVRAALGMQPQDALLAEYEAQGRDIWLGRQRERQLIAEAEREAARRRG